MTNLNEVRGYDESNNHLTHELDMIMSNFTNQVNCHLGHWATNAIMNFDEV